MIFLREFFVMFIILYIVNFIILFCGKKKYNKKKNSSLGFYLNKLYGINISKSIYVKYIWLFALINSFIIDTSYIVIIYLLHNIVLRFIFGIILIILLIIICYGIFARIYLMKEGKKNV